MATTRSTHRREHRSLLANAEKRLLTAIARRLPTTVNSDHLSALAFGAMAGVGAGFALMRMTPWGVVLVVGGLATNWFGDSLDGTLARVRGHERPRFGYYVDHAIDLGGTVLLFTGLAVSGLMTPVMAVAALAGYLLVCAEAFLATHAGGVFRISKAGVGPTELRILLAAGAIDAVWHPLVTLPWLGAHPLFDIGGAVAVIGFAAAFAASALERTRDLYRLEPLPTARDRRGPASTELTDAVS